MHSFVHYESILGQVPGVFWGQKSNLHKSILNDFEKIADNFFIIHYLLNYRFLQRN